MPSSDYIRLDVIFLQPIPLTKALDQSESSDNNKSALSRSVNLSKPPAERLTEATGLKYLNPSVMSFRHESQWNYTHTTSTGAVEHIKPGRVP